MSEPKNILVTSNDQFNDLIFDFDLNYKTKTYYCELTLKQIWDNFMVKTRPNDRWFANSIEDYIDEIVKQKAIPLFKNKDTVWSNDTGIDHGGIGKLNSVYLMKKDLLNNVNFKYPISITAFDKTSFVIHPGGTRMMFGNVYLKTITVIITDYADIIKQYPHLNFYSYELINYDFSINPLLHVEVPSDYKYCPSAFDKALNPDLYDNCGNKVNSNNRKVVYIKEIVDYNINLSEHSYHRPGTINPPRKFSLKNNEIYVDDMLVHIKENEKWKIAF